MQRGQESPDGYEGVPRIEVPVRTVIATSTTHLPHIEKLGEVHSLVGIDNIKYVSSEAVNQRFAAGKLVEVGRGGAIDLEKVLVLQPDLVMTDAPENALVALREAGVPVVLNAAYAEPSLLGRVEWIKFVGAFFDREDLASAQFDSIVARYEARRALVQDLPVDKRPTVLWGLSGAGPGLCRVAKHITRNCSGTRGQIICGEMMIHDRVCRSILRRFTKRRTMRIAGLR